MMSDHSTADQDLSGNEPRPYGNPYVAGLLLGATLLASFLVLGAGLGASSTPIRCGAWIENLVAPDHTSASAYFGGKYLAGAHHPLRYYLTYMSLGIFLGGLLSGVLGRRISVRVERGKSCPAGKRLALALVGGILIGYASALASGCTSGQALTGGALLANGSIVFMMSVFAAGYAAAYFVRRQWHD
jgi:uncharacterized membrane protein YedE/YeeE